jgi:anti-sigma factor RsiW
MSIGGTQRTNGAEREEIELLMPWYVTGKLDEDDLARVERWLAAHPEDRRLVELARGEADADFAANEAIPLPGRHVLDGLMQTIEADPKRRMGKAAGSLWQRCVGWVGDLEPRTLALAGVTAALLILAQAASIGTLVMQRGTNGYTTASGTKGGEMDSGTFALVSFVPAASAEAITKLLAESGAEIVEGPKAGGLYRVRIASGKLDETAASAALEKLKSRIDLVAFASVTR